MTTKSVFLLGGILLVAAASCRRGGGAAEGRQGTAPLPVEVVVAEKHRVTVPLRETGQLTAKSRIKLSFKTGGLIAKITVDDGATVKKGDLLASLDLSEIEARVREASLAYDKAVRDYRRVYNLYRDSVATLEQLEHIRTARDIAWNNLRIARFNLKHSVIRAPADGKILRRLAESGEMIAPGYPVLLFASTDRAWVVRCHVPDRDIVRIGPGDSARCCSTPGPAVSSRGPSPPQAPPPTPTPTPGRRRSPWLPPTSAWWRASSPTCVYGRRQGRRR